MKLRTTLVLPFVLCLLAGHAAAQSLSLRIDQGLVTLDAENVTVDEVLARWSRATGLNVISTSGQGSDIPVSLHLEGVPERDALRMVLRDLSGYIMGERRDEGTGIVRIDRLIILTESAPRPQDALPAAMRARPLPADGGGDDEQPLPSELAPQTDGPPAP